MIYTYEEIVSLPTISQGHTANLKLEIEHKGIPVRIWKSRMSIADGELDPIQVEACIDGRWEDVTADSAFYLVQGQAMRSAIIMPDGTRIERKTRSEHNAT